MTATAKTTAGRAPAPPAPGTTVKLSRLRKLIAGRMVESLQRSAQLTAVQEADLTLIAGIRERAKTRFREREGCSLTHLAFAARAAVEALLEFPQFNASIAEAGEEVAYHPAVHLGIAVQTPRGLLVPVIRDAAGLTVPQLAVRIADLAARSRSGGIGPDELTGSTFTLTNIGSFGSLLDTPIINPPEAAILGTGAITREPRVLPGADGAETIAVRSICRLPLTYDHRLLDGADAGRFLAAVRRRLERDGYAGELAAYEERP
jgi:pyruvate dehydrogenase E2 component (dihydrolipoamide acetyltransferase)